LSVPRKKSKQLLKLFIRRRGRTTSEIESLEEVLRSVAAEALS
jgi:hypothetical protein